MHIEPELNGKDVPLLAENASERSRKYADITDIDLQESSRQVNRDGSDEENDESRY